MITPENLYEEIITNRAPHLDQKAKERAIRSLREIDTHGRNLSGIVGPATGLELLLDLTFSGTAELTAEEFVESEYNEINLKPVSEKVLALTFHIYDHPSRYFMLSADEVVKNAAEWQALEEEFPPYAKRISLLSDIFKVIGYPRMRRYYFHKLGLKIYGGADELLSIFLRARGYYPSQELLNTDYQAESAEMLETLESIAPADSKENVITPEGVMGLYLAGRLKIERQFGTFPHVSLNVLNLPIRAHNALYRSGVETIEELQWLLLPENEGVIRNIRNFGGKSLSEVKESLNTYQQNNP